MKINTKNMKGYEKMMEEQFVNDIKNGFLL